MYIYIYTHVGVYIYIYIYIHIYIIDAGFQTGSGRTLVLSFYRWATNPLQFCHMLFKCACLPHIP